MTWRELMTHKNEIIGIGKPGGEKRVARLTVRDEGGRVVFTHPGFALGRRALGKDHLEDEIQGSVIDTNV
jgi:hypothetical protein